MTLLNLIMARTKARMDRQIDEQCAARIANPLVGLGWAGAAAGKPDAPKTLKLDLSKYTFDKSEFYK